MTTCTCAHVTSQSSCPTAKHDDPALALSASTLNMDAAWLLGGKSSSAIAARTHSVQHELRHKVELCLLPAHTLPQPQNKGYMRCATRTNSAHSQRRLCLQSLPPNPTPKAHKQHQMHTRECRVPPAQSSWHLSRHEKDCAQDLCSNNGIHTTKLAVGNSSPNFIAQPGNNTQNVASCAHKDMCGCGSSTLTNLPPTAQAPLRHPCATSPHARCSCARLRSGCAAQ